MQPGGIYTEVDLPRFVLHPQIYQEASMYNATQELQYLDMVIQESLRMYPPGARWDSPSHSIPFPTLPCNCIDQNYNYKSLVIHYRTTRHAQKTIDINGVTIPEGATVHLPILLFHYNPEYWTEPEKFDPERCSPPSLSLCLFRTLPQSPSFYPFLSSLILSSGSLLRRRQNVLQSATCLLVGVLGTALGWGLPSWRLRWLSLRSWRSTHLCVLQKQRLGMYHRVYLMPLPMLACCTQALRSYQLEGTHIAVIHCFCCMSLASSCAEGQR